MCFLPSLSRAVGPVSCRTRLSPGGSRPDGRGPGAPDDLDQAHRTQAWLAVSDDVAARVSGSYFYHLRPRTPNPEAYSPDLQDQLIEACQRLSGIALPA